MNTDFRGSCAKMSYDAHKYLSRGILSTGISVYMLVYPCTNMYRDAKDGNIRQASISNGIHQVQHRISICTMNLKISWPLSIARYCRRL